MDDDSAVNSWNARHVKQTLSLIIFFATHLKY